MNIEMNKLLTNSWQKMTHWWGNPELGYECWGKQYTKGYSHVYVFGKPYNKEDKMSGYVFCVRHSHSGMFKKDSTPEQVMEYIDLRQKLGLLDNGRNLTKNELKKLKLWNG